MKHLSLISLLLPLIFVTLMLFCNHLPQDPAENPRYADVTLLFDNVIIHQGDEPTIGVNLFFAHHFQTVTVTTSCGIFTTSLSTDSLEITDTVYFKPQFNIAGPCTVFVSAQYKDKDLRNKCDTLPLYILSKETGIYFITTQTPVKTITGKTDTLLFVTRTSSGTVLLPEYKVSSVPTAGVIITPLYSQQKDTLRIVTVASVADTFTIKVVGSVLYGNSVIADSAFTGIRVNNPTSATSRDDTVPPAAYIINPLTSSARIQFLPLTIQLSCSDENGIDTVHCVLNGERLTVSKNQDSLYSVEITSLTTGKSDTAHFTITDNSTRHNSKNFPVIVNYNRPPSELIVSSPAANATGVTRSPSFTWSGGIDPDGDTVYYKVVYGTAAASLVSQTTFFTAPPVTLPPETILEPKTVYYWQLIAWTKVYNDTVRSDIVSFTTTGTGPAISEHPENQQVKIGQKAYFKVTATGTDLMYQWQRNSITIHGAVSPVCTTSQVTAADNGVIFRCVVFNTLDTVFSNDASLIALHSISYNANTATGSVPVDTNGYTLGSIVSIKSNSDVNEGTQASKTGYTFSGWSTNSAGSGKTYRGDGTDTLRMPLAPVTFYAKWVIDTFTVTFISTGTTVFQTQRITYNGQATLPVTQPAFAGNAFEGWFTTNDISGVSFDFSSTITTNRTLYARWVPVYNIVYQANGGAGVVPVDSKKYRSGEQVTIFDNTGGLTKANNDFAGWTLSAQGTGTVYNAGDHITVGSEDVVLYAKWTIKQCQITYSTHGGSAVNSQTVSIGSQITKPVSTLSGLTLVGWYTDTGYTNLWDFSTVVSASMTLHAKFEVRDRDGNSYDTVRIGTQTWMVQNLRTRKYNDGTPISLLTDSSDWANNISAACCWPNGSASNGASYGLLYNHYAARSPNIAPAGWHVPSHEEWTIFTNYLIEHGYNYDGSTTDNKIAKSLAAKTGWNSTSDENTPGYDLTTNNSSKFTALPAGSRSEDGNYGSFGDMCSWWSTTAISGTLYWMPTLSSTSTGFGLGMHYYERIGVSIRCIKDQ